jgi:NADH-quinone oxidoreductase subunit N
MIVFGLVLKLVTTFSASLGTFVEYALLFSGFSSITLSSIAALYQKRTKRLLAYSTISHTGFILVAIACNSIESSKTTVIYLPIYVMMTLTIFVIVFTAMQSNRVLKFLLN